MSEETPEKPKDEPYVAPKHYSNNSVQGHDSESEDAPRIEKIISGEVIKKKKGLGSRIKDTFAGDDANSVLSFIIFDVAVPALKNLIADAATQGTERLLFGDSSRRNGSSSRNYRPTSNGAAGYNRFYGGMPPRDEPYNPGSSRAYSDRARANHSFDDIILQSRGEAEAVLDGLRRLVAQYELARVSDLYSAVDIPIKFVDNNWGWTNLDHAGISRVRQGFLLDLPRPEQI